MTGHTRELRPGHVLYDTAGRTAQLHGIGLLHSDGRWYAWGEDKTAGGAFTAVACYSSEDLVTWQREADSLRVADGDLAADRVVERPKVLRRPDGTWVMFLHIDSAAYSDARVGFAVATTPAGPYTYLGSTRPLGNLSRDIGVYQEGDDAYLLSEDRDHGLHIYRLDDDYLAVAERLATLVNPAIAPIGYESPALLRHDGIYYLFGSGLTGWSMNDNKYCTATSITGPWSPWRDFAPPGTATFQSQVSTVVRVGSGFMYVGDRWLRDDLASSPPVWLPLSLRAGEAHLEWRDSWHPRELLTS